MMKVLVTGATGSVGSGVVRELAARGVPVRAFVRDAAKAAAMLGDGVEIAVGDLAERGSIERALDGTDRMFLASGNVAGQVGLETAAIDAARAADAKVAMIHPGDVAAVAATVLTGDGHDGRVYTLTGPEAVTLHQAAEQLSAGLGRPVEYVDVPDEAARAATVQAGLPEFVAGEIVALWGELRRGILSTTTDVVRVLTGREPRSVADFARDFAPAFGVPVG